MKSKVQKSVVSESSIQTAICDYLSYKRLFFWRQNVNPIFDKKTNTFRRMPAYSKNGVPDIILVKGGKFIGLEVKRPKGIQSEHQKTFEADCKKAGGEYYIITSVDDVQKLGI
jgi:hypothetical protein